MSKKTTTTTTTENEPLQLTPMTTLRVSMHRNRTRCKATQYIHTIGCLVGNDVANEIGVDGAILDKIMDGIVRILHTGYEVRLGDYDNGIRFYPCRDAQLNLLLCARTMGDYRTETLSDMKTETWRGRDETGHAMTDEEVHNLVEKQDKAHQQYKAMQCVSPDTMVTCPQCGASFRVGRALSSIK